MKLIRMAILVGMIVAVPLCAMIYLGVARLEHTARESIRLRDSLSELSDQVTPVRTMLDELDPDGGEMDGGSEPSTESQPKPENGAFPVVKRLENQKRQALDVVVTGRSEEALHFLSLRDNRLYRYPIAGLSERDQAFSAGLPVWESTAGNYPVARQLRDVVGRSLVTVIDGRSEREVFFRTLPEGERHSYPIHRLSPTDRHYVMSLPVSSGRDGGRSSGVPSSLGTGRLEPAEGLDPSGPLLPLPKTR
ncbi:MAG: hypothetical protein JNK37_13095 [Verrucomicrobiales bacterium]|nr:hypothetical protein [Verrucomicrobiales bacterium]